jgi:hypothetical protein
MQLTRRKLARAVLGSAAAQAVAQTPASAPPTPDEDLRAARERMKANSDALAGQAVPMAAEPAFQFRA